MDSRRCCKGADLTNTAVKENVTLHTSDYQDRHMLTHWEKQKECLHTVTQSPSKDDLRGQRLKSETQTPTVQCTIKGQIFYCSYSVNTVLRPQSLGKLYSVSVDNRTQNKCYYDLEI